MNDKLILEWRRLFLVPSEVGAESALADGQGRVRALVLELTRAPDWPPLGRVWQGVQAELGLPAPGIAVSGVDALQLWFSLARPVAAAQGRAFLVGLCRRFLADVEPRRLRLWPAEAGAASSAHSQVALVPALQPSGNWSAFVAPDLAPVFGDTPWLDIAPNAEGQASLLRALAPMPVADFEAALATMGVDRQAAQAGAEAPLPVAAPAPASPAPSAVSVRPESPSSDDALARRFLRQVMQDESASLALRIEAARALLLQPAR